MDRREIYNNIIDIIVLYFSIGYNNGGICVQEHVIVVWGLLIGSSRVSVNAIEFINMFV
jgi:hypothetical protein